MIAPDDDLSKEEALDGPEDAETEGKAALDDSEADAGEDVPRALQKVELDLDDAPFLEEDEDEEDEEPDTAEEQLEEKTEKKKLSLAGLLKNRKVLIGLLVLLVILIAIPIKIWLLPKGEKVVEEIKPAQTEETAPEAPAEPEVKNIPVVFEPFWVEKAQADGKVRFIHCQFSVTTHNTAAKHEIELKMLVLRDAVFYYLSNKDFAFLADTNNMEVLKKDILAVINKYLGQTQLETLLVEKYLVQ